MERNEEEGSLASFLARDISSRKSERFLPSSEDRSDSMTNVCQQFSEKTRANGLTLGKESTYLFLGAESSFSLLPLKHLKWSKHSLNGLPAA